MQACQGADTSRDFETVANQSLHVIVERRRSPNGCGTTLAVLVLLGLAVKYWYVLLVLLVVAAVIGLQRRQTAKKRNERRPGPQDHWLNEVVIALSDLGLTEVRRNTGGQLGSVALEGDVGLQDERFLLYVNLFGSSALARQAELSLRAQAKVQQAIAAGRTALRGESRIVFVANGRGGVVDEFRLEEVVRLTRGVRLPPALGAPPPASVAQTDVLEQLRRLADLQRAGTITQAEFDEKKRDLLDRI
jgi:hypothetical protein